MHAANIPPDALRQRADRDLVLFSFFDRPVQQALGLWREERR